MYSVTLKRKNHGVVRIKSKQNQNSTMWKSSVHHIWGPRWSRGSHGAWAALLSYSVHSTDSWPCRLHSTAVAVLGICPPSAIYRNQTAAWSILLLGSLQGLLPGTKPQHLTMAPSPWASLEDVPLPMASPGFSQYQATSYSYKIPSVVSTVKYTLDHLWIPDFVRWHGGNTPRRIDLNGADL